MTAIGVTVIGIITGMEITGVGIAGMVQVGVGVGIAGMDQAGAWAGIIGMVQVIMDIMEVIIITGMETITIITTIIMVDEEVLLMLIPQTETDTVLEMAPEVQISLTEEVVHTHHPEQEIQIITAHELLQTILLELIIQTQQDLTLRLNQ